MSVCWPAAVILRAIGNIGGEDGEGLHWIGKATLWPNPELDALNLFPAAKRDLEVREPILINELLRNGAGMAIMPLDATLLFPELAVVPDTPIAGDRTLWVLYHSDLRNSARVKVVVDFLSKMVGGGCRKRSQVDP